MPIKASAHQIIWQFSLARNMFSLARNPCCPISLQNLYHHKFTISLLIAITQFSS